MAYSTTELIENVRTILHNIGSARIDDEELLTFARHALALLHTYRPNLVTANIAGAGKYNYRLDNLTGWIPGVSEPKWLAHAPDLDADEAPILIGSDRYSTYGPTPDGQTWMIFKDQIESGSSVTIGFTGEWQIDGLDNAESTTLTHPILRSAFEYLVVHLVCKTMAIAAAGYTSPGIPADIVNWENKSEQYRMAADLFWHEFQTRLGLAPEMSIPAGGFFVTEMPDDSDWPRYHTHRRNRRY